MKNFWLLFAIQSAIGAAAAVVNLSSLSSAQKAALQSLIFAAQQVQSAFGPGGAGPQALEAKQ